MGTVGHSSLTLILFMIGINLRKSYMKEGGILHDMNFEIIFDIIHSYTGGV